MAAAAAAAATACMWRECGSRPPRWTVRGSAFCQGEKEARQGAGGSPNIVQNNRVDGLTEGKAPCNRVPRVSCCSWYHAFATRTDGICCTCYAGSCEALTSDGVRLSQSKRQCIPPPVHGARRRLHR